MQPRLIYFCHEPVGGLADYAHAQASALSALGVQVLLVAAPQFAANRQPAGYSLLPILADPPAKSKQTSRLVRGFRSARWFLNSVNRLASYIRSEGDNRILIGAYFEYLAPFWAAKLRQCALNNTIFGAVVHDPVRGAFIGPRWWHQYSIASAYSFIREAFVHYAVELDTVRPMPNLRTTVIPHGPYHFLRASVPRHAMRNRLEIPHDASLMLAFGYIRDYKNLHLVLEAMVRCPQFYLLVAGAEMGSGERTAADYRILAAQLGVASRCRWDIRHIAENEVGNLFEAADLVLLTYSSAFRSASGVLNAAVNFRKLCLASSGSGNLRGVVEQYGLGYWVPPDSVTEIARGLQRYLEERPIPDLDRYANENSWEQNARMVIDRMFGRTLSIHATRPEALHKERLCTAARDFNA